MRVATIGLLALCAVVPGCDGCHRAPPHIVLPDVQHDADGSADDPAGESHDGGALPDAQAVLSGAPAGDGSTIDLDGVTVRAPAGLHFTQTLALDVDGDGDRDLLASSARGDGTVAAIAFYRRSPAGFAPVPIVGSALPAAGAVPVAVQMRSTSPRSVVLVYRALPTTTPDAGVATDPSEEHVVVSLGGPSPSVRTRIALIAPVPASTLLDAVVDLVDRDGDGRDDIVVSVGARLPRDRVDRAARANLVWLDRPSGLARDTSEPEASFARLAAQARSMATRRRARDVPDFHARVVRLRRALCSDAGTARIRIGSEVGVSCAGSAGLRGVADALARAYLVTGELPAAVALTRPDTASELGVVDPTHVLAEIHRPASVDARVIYRAGPAVAQSLDSVLLARAPVLAFEPPAHPTTLLVRGPVTARIDLATLAATAGPPGTLDDVRLRDEQTGSELEGFVDRCDGVFAVVCGLHDEACRTSTQPIAGTPHFECLADLPPVAIAAACLRGQSTPVRAYDVRAVSLARDGLRVIRAGLTIHAVESGAPAIDAVNHAAWGQPVGERTDPARVVATAEGLFVRVVDPAAGSARWMLWAPAALAGRFAQLTDLIVSDDQQTVAGLLGGQVVVLTHEGAIASPIAAPTTDAAP